MGVGFLKTDCSKCQHDKIFHNRYGRCGKLNCDCYNEVLGF